MLQYQGHLQKMTTEHLAVPEQGNVQYGLVLDENRIEMNKLIGRTIQIAFGGAIHCSHCGRKTNKSFNQGYCYPCFRKLAQCDSCIMSPERCHYDAGTCREPDWADRFCMTDHIVYLANSAGVKVGITRLNQVPTRWMDQGATQALPIFRVATRQLSGLVEAAFREHVGDKTNWRALLKGEGESVDLETLRDQLFEKTHAVITGLQQAHGLSSVQPIVDGELYEFEYPVQQYASKVKTHNLDKTPVVEGVLQGIRGQYLLLDTGAINIRKFGAYHVTVSIAES